MKHFKLISILCVALGVSAAQAETKVSGEFFGNFTYELDNGEAGGDDRTTGYGFETERARVGVTHSFNDNWSATFLVDAAGSVGTFDKAHITAKNWLADGHTMHFGLQQNAYNRAWDSMNARWIHSDLTSANGGDVYGTHFTNVGGVAGVDYYSGLNYNIAFNDMWNIELSLNNGQDTNFAGQADTMGYGLTVNGKINDNFAVLVGYDNANDYDGTPADANDDTNEDGFTVLRASLFYMSDMIDAGFEYADWDYNEDDAATDTNKDAIGAMALHAHWKYAEAKGVFAKYTMFNSDYEDSAIGTENSMTLGHTWSLDKGINTGLFYTATSKKVSDDDSSAIMWKWAASF